MIDVAIAISSIDLLVARTFVFFSMNVSLAVADLQRAPTRTTFFNRLNELIEGNSEHTVAMLHCVCTVHGAFYANGFIVCKLL